MNTRPAFAFKTFPLTHSFLLALTIATAIAPFAQAQPQQAQIQQARIQDDAPARPTLPDSPGTSLISSSSTDSAFAGSAVIGPSDSSSATSDAPAPPDAEDAMSATNSRWRLHVATRHDITIQPGEVAPHLSTRDKAVLGFSGSFSLFSAFGWLGAAGYSQLVNGSPNFGTDSGAFGERLGACALHGISHNIIGNAVFAPLFHDDPRYYRMGPGHNVGRRLVYSITRTLVTRSDDGADRPNYSLIAGNVAGAALTNAYYPEVNQGATETAKTFGTSMAGSAFGFVVTEFLDDAFQAIHLKKPE